MIVKNYQRTYRKYLFIITGLQNDYSSRDTISDKQISCKGFENWTINKNGRRVFLYKWFKRLTLQGRILRFFIPVSERKKKIQHEPTAKIESDRICGEHLD
jgi:hypothetical protein